jgi:hypothetical protein
MTNDWHKARKGVGSLFTILLKNPIAEALFMLIDVERRMIFHCGSSLQ